MNNEYKIKLIFLGNSGVGKTCLFNEISLINNYNTLPTIGMQCIFKKHILPNNDKLIINYCDTAGQERYNSIISSYFRNIFCLILLYDITNIKSFNDIEKWYNMCLNQSKPELIFLIGNKLDLKNKRLINKEEGIKLAEKLNAEFLELSSLDIYDTNMFKEFIIIKTFEKIINIQYNKRKLDNLDKNINLDIDTNVEIKTKKYFCF